MVAGIVLFALGLQETLAHAGEGLGPVPAVGLSGGAALYLLGMSRSCSGQLVEFSGGGPSVPWRCSR